MGPSSFSLTQPSQPPPTTPARGSENSASHRSGNSSNPRTPQSQSCAIVPGPSVPGSMNTPFCEMDLPLFSLPEPSQLPLKTPARGSENSSPHRSGNSSNPQTPQSQSYQTSTVPGPSVPGSMKTPSCESGIPTGLVSKACTCNCEQLASRVMQLEQKVGHLMTMQTQAAETTSISTKMGARWRLE